MRGAVAVRRSCVTPAQSRSASADVAAAAACASLRANAAIEEPARQHAQHARHERHRPRQHVEALASRDRARDEPRGFVRREQERHAVRILRRHRRRDVAGANRHDRDAAAAQLDAQALEIRDRRRLRAGVRARARECRGSRRRSRCRPARRACASRIGCRNGWNVCTRPITLVSNTARNAGRSSAMLRQRAARHARVGDDDVGRAEARDEIGAARERALRRRARRPRRSRRSPARVPPRAARARSRAARTGRAWRPAQRSGGRAPRRGPTSRR